MPEKPPSQKHEVPTPLERELFGDPVAWMSACMAATDEVARLREKALRVPLTRAEYARITQEVWDVRLRRLRFTRAVAPSSSFMDRLVRDAGWVFRQEVASGTVGVFNFAIDVDTLSTPVEARLALERATGSPFDVEFLEDRPARLGDGEGPALPRPESGARPYHQCLADRFDLGVTRARLPNALGADAVCDRFGLTLWRFANLVELGVIPLGNRRDMQTSAAKRPFKVQTWTEEDLKGLSDL